MTPWRLYDNKAAFALLSVLLSLGLQAQNRTIEFDPVSLASKMSETTTYAIAQDQKGYLYISTNGGLNRYDGYEMTVFLHDPNDPASISGDRISALWVNPDGTLWVGTWGQGLNLFDTETLRFKRSLPDQGRADALGGPKVQVLFRDRAGTLWVGFNENGLSRHLGDDRWEHHRHDPQDPTSMSSNRIWDIDEDYAGNLWLATSKGLDYLNVAEGTVKRYESGKGKGGPSHPEVRALMRDRSGNLWLATRAGIDRLEFETKRFEHFQPFPLDPKPDRNIVSDIFEDSTGRIWLGLESSGLFLFDPVAREFVRVVYRERFSVPNDIRRFMEDASGNIWFATQGGGAFKINASRFEHFVSDPQDRRSLSDPNVNTFLQDSLDRLWVGTEFGLNRYDPKDGGFEHYLPNPTQPGSLSHHFVRYLHEDQRSYLWVATQNGLSVSPVDQKAPVFKTYYADADDPNSLPHNRINLLEEDSLNRLWVGTHGGLVRVRSDRSGFERIPVGLDNPEGTTAAFITSLKRDKDGLWIGTYNGLDFLPLNSAQMRRYRAQPDSPNTLAGRTILNVVPDERDGGRSVWVGTLQGLFHLDRETGASRHYEAAEGLPNENVFGIVPDDSGKLWMSTKLGITRFDPQTDVFKNFDTSFGLQGLEFSPSAYYKDRLGRIYFGGTNGFNRFYAGEIRDNTRMPDIVLTEVSVNGVALDQDARADLSLPSHRNALRFSFSALDFTDVSRNSYRYRLDPIDQDWVDAGTVPFADYRNLKPGDYTFRVRGSNNDEVWNMTGVTYSFEISQPWWMTRGFRISAITAVIALFLAIVWWGRIGRKRGRSDLRIALREMELKLEVRRSESEKYKKENLIIEERMRSLLESLEMAVVLCDADRRIVAWNARAGDVFGYRRKDVLGKPISFLEGRGDRSDLLHNLERSGGDRRRELSITARRKDSSRLQLDVAINAWHTGAGEFYCLTFVRQNEAQVAEASKPKKAMSDPLADMVTGYVGPRRKILVADDRRDRRQQIERYLRPLEFEVIAAENGLQAFERTEQERPDLVLMDLVMPVMDGLESTRLIHRSISADLPVIGMSSSAAEDLEHKAKTAGCDGVLAKPIRRKQLLSVIGEHLQLEWTYLKDREHAQT